MSDATTTASPTMRKAFTIAIVGYLIAWAATLVFVSCVFGSGLVIGLSLVPAVPFVIALLMRGRWETVRQRELALLFTLVVLVAGAVVFVIFGSYAAGIDRRHAVNVACAEFSRLLLADPAFRYVTLSHENYKSPVAVRGVVDSHADLDRLLTLADQRLTWWSDQVNVVACPKRITANDLPPWEPHDFSFTGNTAGANPFQVAFSATVRGPGGQEFPLPGFFNGKGAWKVRVSPTGEGRWRLITASDVPELNNCRADFVCVGNPTVHGPLRIDREHPHHFVFDDGTRFFLQGYECDWLWALDTDRPDMATLDRFLNVLEDYGFNYVILNSYAYDTHGARARPARTITARRPCARGKAPTPSPTTAA